MLSSPQPDDFSHAFEAAFARLQVFVEEAYGVPGDWPVRIAAAIRAGFEFAAADPETANVLTNEAIARGRDGFARYNRLVDYCAGLLTPGRELQPENEQLPEILERSLAGGLIMLIAQRVDQGRAAELRTLVPEAVQFVLTPYLGLEEARRAAAAGTG
ncbi:MAG TPA: hypothetical protein VF245_04845 [Solirubrobacterales bacterium]